MARFIELIAIMIVLVLQAAGADCVAGSCAADGDATSLVQVMQVTKSRSPTAERWPTHSMHQPDDGRHYNVDFLSEPEEEPKANDKAHDEKHPHKHRGSKDERRHQEYKAKLAAERKEKEERREMRVRKAAKMERKEMLGMERKIGTERRELHSLARRAAMQRSQMREMQRRAAMERRTMAMQRRQRNTATERWEKKRQHMKKAKTNLQKMEQAWSPESEYEHPLPTHHQHHGHYHGKYGGVEDLPQVVDWTAEADTLPGNPGGKAEQAYEHSFHNVKNAEEQGYAKDLKHDAGNAGRLIDMQEKLEHGIGQETDDMFKTYKESQDQIVTTEIQKHHAEQAAYHLEAQARRKLVESALKKMQTERAAIEGQMEGHSVAMQRAAGETNGVMRSLELRMLAKKHEELQRAQNMDHQMKRSAADMYAAEKEAEGRRYMNKVKDTIKAMKDREAAYAGVTEDTIVGPEGIDTRILKDEAEQKSAAYKRVTRQNQRIVDKTASGQWNAHLG